MTTLLAYHKPYTQIITMFCMLYEFAMKTNMSQLFAVMSSISLRFLQYGMKCCQVVNKSFGVIESLIFSGRKIRCFKEDKTNVAQLLPTSFELCFYKVG